MVAWYGCLVWLLDMVTFCYVLPRVATCCYDQVLYQFPRKDKNLSAACQFLPRPAPDWAAPHCAQDVVCRCFLRLLKLFSRYMFRHCNSVCSPTANSVWISVALIEYESPPRPGAESRTLLRSFICLHLPAPLEVLRKV